MGRTTRALGRCVNCNRLHTIIITVTDLLLVKTIYRILCHECRRHYGAQ